MATPVNTVATGGLPVVDVTATTPKFGMPVSEALSGKGIAVTKVANFGMPMTFVPDAGGAGGGATADPSWANVKLLMGFTGTNGATSGPGFVDESGAAHGAAVVAGGNSSQISTAQSVFGGSSLNVVGFERTYFADHADWNLSNGPFTIELRVYFTTGTPASQFLVGQWGGGATCGWELWCNSSSQLALAISTTGNDNIAALVSSTTLVSNTWYAACVDYNGAKYRMYINGVMVASSTTPLTIFNSTYNLAIGASDTGGFYFGGYIDELRITKGVARYASDAGYTVATAAFPRS